MKKLTLGAAAIALTMALGAPSLSADEWHRGGWHRGHSHHYGHYQPRHSYYHPRYSHPRYSWHRGGPSYGELPRGYDGGYGGRAIYNAGFNHGALAQWRIAYQRWAYEHAQWRRPTGIFALAGGLTGGGAGYGGRGYGGGYGPPCNCD
jgi:hypothetical protein